MPTHRYHFKEQLRYYRKEKGSRRKWAQKIVANEIKQRRLRKATEFNCVDCNAPAACYDHSNYRCPLVIEPVCKRCNMLRGPGLNGDERNFK